MTVMKLYSSILKQPSLEESSLAVFTPDSLLSKETKLSEIKLILIERFESNETVFSKYKTYCYPLVLYTIVNFLYSFADNWMLQKFGGAFEQGLYSIGLRFSGFVLLSTTSILNIFWKWHLIVLRNTQ